MPPAKGAVWKHYRNVKSVHGKLLKVACRYCDLEYGFPNATRLEKHLRGCKPCPAWVRILFPDNKKGGKKPTSHQSTEHGGRSESDEADTPDILPASSSKNNSTSSPGTSSSSDLQTLTSVHSEPPAKKPKSVWSYVDSISKEEKIKLDTLAGRAIFSKGLPLSVFEGPHMEEFFHALRPAYKPPAAKVVGGRILNSEYVSLSTKVEPKISNAKCVTVMSDGWVNRKGDGIVNFIVATPEPVFLKGVEVGAVKENAEFMAKELVKVIEEVGAEKVLLMVTDNASTMKKAWKDVRKKYSHIYAIGCGAHGLNLFFKDIMKNNFFETLLTNAKSVVKLRKKRHIYAVFKEKQKANYGSKANSLILPSPTRFSGAYFMFDSLLKNKQALQETMLVPDTGVSNDVRNIVLDNEGFWDQLSVAVDVLKPLVQGIHLIESDCARLSSMIAICMNIKKKIQDISLSTESNLPLLTCINVSRALNYRIHHFCVTDLHRATYMVDPKFVGVGFSDQECLAGIQVVRDLAVFLKLDADAVIDNLADFKTQSNFFENEVIWSSAKTMKSPVTWWNAFCANQPLHPVAVRLLVLVPSAASCERVWSQYEHIQSKKRNRLGNRKTGKLVSVKCHLRLLSPKPETQNKKKVQQDRAVNLKLHGLENFVYEPISLSPEGDSDGESGSGTDDSDDRALWSSDDEIENSSESSGESD